MFRFRFDAFHEWYDSRTKEETRGRDRSRGTFEPLQGSDVVLYESLQGKRNSARFCVTEISNVRRFEYPDMQDSLFPYGVFVVADYACSKGGKWLFFVTPRDDEDRIVGDHFAFVKSKGKSVNFHFTEYDSGRQQEVHTFDDFDDDIELPAEGYEGFPLFKKFQSKRVLKRYMSFLIDVIRMPWKKDDVTVPKRRKTGGMPSAYLSSSSRPTRQTVASKKITDKRLFQTVFGGTNTHLVCFMFKKRTVTHVHCSLYDSHHWADRGMDQARSSWSFTLTGHVDEEALREAVVNTYDELVAQR